MSKIEFLWKQASSRLWVRPTLLSSVTVTWVYLAFVLGNRMTFDVKVDIARETLLNLFTILGSTMLTVATFAVSAIASAYGAVASSATPRATRIVMQDGGVRSSLSAFLATFIYAMVGITSLSAFRFSSAGRLMLFFAFVVLVSWVLISFLRWVDQVSRLGRLGDTIRRVADVGCAAFGNPDLVGTLAGRCAIEAPPEGGVELRDGRFGYVQHVDMPVLQSLAEEMNGEIWLKVRTGAFITAGLPVAVVVTDVANEEWPEDLQVRLQSAITVGPERSAETDPRFAMILLAEIADRALSPAVNDPGTAIAVLTKQMELFHRWVDGQREGKGRNGCEFDRVWVTPVKAQDLVWDAFTPIARDGAGILEVSLRLQKALLSLSHMGHHDLMEAAKDYSGEALKLSEHALVLESQKAAIRELAERVRGL